MEKPGNSVNYVNNIIILSDQGAEFVVAKVDSCLQDILNQRPNLKPELLNDLLPRPIGAAAELTDPLLAIQVNVFACGGLAIAVCSFHKIADMASTSSFIKAWADIAAEKDHENCIPSNLNSALLFPGKGMSGLPLGISRDKENIKVHKIVTKLFSFSKIAISRIQEKAKLDNSSKRYVSRLQSVCGIIGKAIIDMHLAIPGSPKGYIVSQSVNMRERTFPALPNQFGNLYTVATAQSVAGEKGVDFQSFVHLLSDSVKRSTDRCEKVLSLGEAGQMIVTQGFGELIQGVMNPEINFGGSFTSWCKFPFYESDFGWGKPDWVGSVNVPVNKMIILIDEKSGEGIEAWVSLDENDMPKFEQDGNIIEFTT